MVEAAKYLAVSIHAPYAGSDFIEAHYMQNKSGFNPRPLCRERRACMYLPAHLAFCFNPRPLCRERQPNDLFPGTPYPVSIHAPYAGSDRCSPRPPQSPKRVSIHAPYAGSDVFFRAALYSSIGFNPRPLCRERPSAHIKYARAPQFQSTPPMQGATLSSPCPAPLLKQFQSTPPMQGATGSRSSCH